MHTDGVQIVDGVLETVVTNEDVRQTYVEDVANELAGDTGYSKAVMKMFRRAKRASKAQDMKSRNSVTEMRLTWEMVVGDMQGTSVGVGQSTLFDFGE